MSSTTEKPNPFKIFGIASGITFLSYIHLRISGLDLIYLPIIFIVFFVIAFTIAFVVIKLGLDPQGHNRPSLKNEMRQILKSLGVTKQDMETFFKEVSTLGKDAKPYMRDVVESYYGLVCTRKMTQEEWFRTTFPGK